MNCDHIIGTAESDYQQFNVHIGETPDISAVNFHAFDFCPKCGLKLTTEPEQYLVAMEEVRANYRPFVPTTPLEIAWHKHCERLMKAMHDIPPPRMSPLLDKGPMPEGLGYNYPRTEIRPVTASEINLLKKQTEAL